jgi:hypothetical protein
MIIMAKGGSLLYAVIGIAVMAFVISGIVNQNSETTRLGNIKGVAMASKSTWPYGCFSPSVSCCTDIQPGGTRSWCQTSNSCWSCGGDWCNIEDEYCLNDAGQKKSRAEMI